MVRLWIFVFIALLLFSSSGVTAKVGGGDVVINVERMKSVIFSHDKHVSDSGLQCTQCHDKLYVTREKHRKVTMAQMQRGQSCGACHNGKKAFDVKGNCETCHK